MKLALGKPKTERNNIFSNFKKEGINQHNMAEVKKPNPSFERERQLRKCENIVKCTHCNGFFAKTYFARHMRNCGSDGCSPKIAIPVEDIAEPTIEVQEQFKTDVLTGLRDDTIGRLVKNDTTILMIGSRLYDKVKRRFDKKLEVQSSVRTDMRRLAHLYTHFKVYKPIIEPHGNAADMFLRRNFSVLGQAIAEYTASNEQVQKAGLKAALFYLIQGSAKKCIANFMLLDNDVSKTDVENFMILLNYCKDELFGDATYELNQRRNINSKKPAQLPLENDLELIRNHTIEVIKKYASDPFHIWDVHSFKELRDATCTRLTLYNGRRGGEPARLSIREWKEAESGSWVDKQRVNTESKTLITYQSGKGIKRYLLFKSK